MQTNQKETYFEVKVTTAVGKKQFDRKHMQMGSESESGPEQGSNIDDAIHDEPFLDYDVIARVAVRRLVTPLQTRKKSRKNAPTSKYV